MDVPLFSLLQVAQPGYSFETGEKGPGLNVLMGDIDPDNAAGYQANAKQFFDLYLQQTIPCAALLYPFVVLSYCLLYLSQLSDGA